MLNIAGLLGGNAIDDFIKGISGILDKAFPSPEERAKAEAILEAIKQHPDDLQQELLKLQASTNIEEAKSSDWFRGGWRPLFGYVLALSAGIYFIPRFVFGTFLWVKLSLLHGNIEPYPIDVSDLMALSANMLGLSYIRMNEKISLDKNKINLPQPFR